jgi:hypothetical protein
MYRVIKKTLYTRLLYCNHKVHKDFLITMYNFCMLNLVVREIIARIYKDNICVGARIAQSV